MTASTELRRAAAHLTPDAIPDGELLARFLEHRDESAFAVLVRRHAAMVLGTCRRVLGNAADADDAFQAAFVVLVRKASTLTDRRCVGNFLYGIAFRTALKAKAMAANRRAREAGAKPPAPRADPSELLAALDEELARLPEKYRAAVVLCELEGRSRHTAAEALGVAEGTISSRLATAHRMLERRLRSRGFAGVVVAVLFAGARAEASESHIASAVRAASEPSHAVSQLASEVTKMLLLHKLGLTTLVIALVVTLAAAAVAMMPQTPAEEPKPKPKPVAAQPAPKADPVAQEPARKAEGRQTYELAGRMESAAAAEVRARVAGQVTRVAVREGDTVKKGDVLVEIDPRAYQIELDAARARLKVAEAKLQAARIKSASTKRLHKNNVVSEDEVALIVAVEAETEAALAVARAEAERAALTLSWTRVTAPVGGRVSRVLSNEGELATADRTPLLKIVVTDPLEVMFDVPEATLLRLRRDGLAEPGRLSVAVGFADDEGYPHAARLDAIAPEVDPRTGTVRFRAKVPNPKGLFLPGMFARVRLTAAPK